MAELTFKSAGVSTREIDLSGPRDVAPVGVPAGIIGTALEGPAFVPLTFASFTKFQTTFGATDGEKFGPIAVNEWLRNAQSCAYLRVLGAGDGKKRASDTGNVTNAGFKVGDRIPQPNGLLGDNPHANASVAGNPASLVLKIDSGNGAANGNIMRWVAEGKTFTITFSTGTAYGSSASTWTGGSGTTPTATIGLDDSGTDDATDLEVLERIRILAALVGGSTADGTGYTVTKDESAKTVTITADVNVASTYDFSGVITPGDMTGTATAGANYEPATKGRSYFLGTFMSESNGSTIFSEAGIQQQSVRASGEVIDLAGYANGDTVGITVPLSAGGSGVQFKFKLATGDTTGEAGDGADQLGIGLDGTPSAAAVAAAVVAFINAGTTSGITNLGAPESATAPADYANGVAGITAEVTNTSKITITADNIGVAGNSIAIANVAGDAATATSLPTKGKGGAVPILRGVVLAPSGVILHLSGNLITAGHTGNDVPSATAVARASINTLKGKKGSVSGSVNLVSQEFVMLLNGFKGTTDNPNAITASFDMTAPNYFRNVFNTDPYSIEEKGHYLYGSYDIYPTLASVTGSGALPANQKHDGLDMVGFMLTSSLDREAAATSTTAQYESFEDRFTHAESPHVISQAFGGTNYDLFKIHALSDGAGVSDRYKVSIENLTVSTSDIEKHGTFDLLVRRFSDTDDERVVLESFRGLSLDPGSNRYIARAIGDQNIFYNFDNDLESQKIVVDGSHPVRSRYIRVQMSDAMKKKEVPDTALPTGYRGPRHLNTSGSLLLNGQESSSAYVEADILNRVVEPPIPYRDTVAQGTGLKKRVDSRLYWGLQSTRKTSAVTPNKVGLFDQSLYTYVKHFPKHRTDSISFSSGDNANAADSFGTVLDSDRFNKNKFSLEHIRVRTGSDGIANPDMWHSASYVRSGIIAKDDSPPASSATGQTRAFQITDLAKVNNRKFVKFTFPLQGGFDGVNILNKDKKNLTNTAAKKEIDDPNQKGTADSTVGSYRKAIDIMASKTDVDIQLLAIPGIRHSAVTDFAINATEQRFDAMYIMDIEMRDQFNLVVSSSDQMPHVSNTVTAFKNRSLDSSFAAAYFPDIVVADPTTGGLLAVPPSVAVLGAYSLNDKLGHPWFAPAGFTRGALNSVEMASVKLNRTNLDDLYDADINPITAFPGTGITVWGQKTLLAAPSALDRVNVRRLLINVRRKVKNIANTLLFEPNRSETLEKFSALVNPVLQTVQEQSGVDRFKVLIDTTTTTQADVENNTIRGKIFLQPTRSVEFVALDFVVTNAGSNI